MADVLPLNFSPPAENVISSYDFADIISGISYKVFYAGCTRTAGTLGYKLFSTALEVGDNGAPGAAVSDARISNINSETTFSTGAFTFPREIEGDAFIVFSVINSDLAGGSGTITVKIYKNSTQIGTSTWTGPTTNAVTTTNMKITLARTHFAIGDELKVSWDSDRNDDWLLNDPLNRDNPGFDTGVAGLGIVGATTVSTNQTKAEVYIPFRVQL